MHPALTMCPEHNAGADMSTEEIKRTVNILFAPEEVYELRVFYKNDKKGAASGYFNNANVDKLIEVIRKHETDPSVSGIYITCLLYTSDAADDLLCVDLG